MKILAIIPLSLVLAVALAAGTDTGDVGNATLFKTLHQGQSSFPAKPFLQLAQGASEVDECLEKCEEELTSCRESGKDESECGEALNACQQACEEQG